jgi:hypothetical protein
MAQIDLGKFGRASPVVVPAQVAPANADVAWDQTARVGAVGFSVSKDYLDGINRGKIGLAAQSFDEAMDRAAIETTQKTQAGELSPMQAEAYFQSVLDKIEPEAIPYLSQEQETVYQLALQQSKQRAMRRVMVGAKGAAEVEQNRIAAAYPDGAFRAAIVAEDPEMQIERLRTAAQPGGILAKAYGAEKAAEVVADTATKIYESRARSDIEAFEAKGDAVSLGKLQAELLDENSLKARRLADRRAAVLSQVTSTIDRVTNRSEHDGRQREAGARRALQDATEGMTLGVVFSPAQISAMEATVSGTESEPLFRELMESAGAVHKAATASPDESAKSITDTANRVTEAKAAGNVPLTKKLTRLAEALTSAATTALARMGRNPVDFVESRTGRVFAPIDANDFLKPDELAKKIGERVDAVTALRGTPGFERRVGYGVLKAPEAASLHGLITGSNHQQSALLLHGLLKATKRDQAAYSSTLAQIADHGSKAIALAGLRIEMPVKGYAGRDMPEVNVGEYILEGMDTLGQLKPPQKNEATAKQSDVVPGRDVFAKALGESPDWFKAISVEDRDAVLDAARAFYAAMLNHNHFGPDPDTSTREGQAAKAIKAVAGNAIRSPVGNSDSTLLVPWGMSTDKFRAQLKEAWAIAVTQGRVDPGKESAFRIYAVPGSNGLRFRFAWREGLLDDKTDKTKPFELTVSPPVP